MIAAKFSSLPPTVMLTSVVLPLSAGTWFAATSAVVAPIQGDVVRAERGCGGRTEQGPAQSARRPPARQWGARHRTSRQGPTETDKSSDFALVEVSAQR